MADYIEREQAVTVFKTFYGRPLRIMLEALAEEHAADVRPVVLCRECVHWERYDNTAGCGYCHKVKFEYGANGYVFNPVRAPDFYCADGEKREES